MYHNTTVNTRAFKNNPKRERPHGLLELVDTNASSDDGADDHGDTGSSSIMPEIRWTMDWGYCLAFGE